MDPSSKHYGSTEVLNLQVDEEEFECSICDFKCPSVLGMVQHSESHNNTEVTVDDHHSSNTGNFLKDLENGKGLVVDRTSTTFVIDSLGKLKTLVREKPYSETGDFDTEEFYESNKNEEADKVLLKETQYDEMRNKKDLENRKGLVVDRTSTTFVIDDHGKLKTLVREKPYSETDDFDTEDFYESNKNEEADKVLLKEKQKYDEMRNKIFNEDNYNNCSFENCNLIIYVEQLAKHIQDHQLDNAEKSCNNKKRRLSSVFMCIECGQKYLHFNQISNHIFIHFKEKTPNDRECTCGYRSKRLSSFKIHKCKNLKIVDTNIPKDKKKKSKSVTTNKQIIDGHKGNQKIAVDREFEPSTSESSDNSDISDHFDDSGDSDFKPNNDEEKEESDWGKKDWMDFYSNRVAKMKVSCKICNKEFDNEGLCKEHLNDDQNDCEKEERLVDLCRKEENQDTKISFYVCIKCSRYFNTESACERHIALQHTNIKYHCDQCEFVTSRRYMSTHIKSEHLIQPKCSICNKTFKNKLGLSCHMRYVHSSSHSAKYKKKTSLCNLCGKVFTQRKLGRHMLIHTGKKHDCKLCEFSTVQKYNLVVHMRSHEKKGSVIYKRTQNKLKDENYS